MTVQITDAFYVFRYWQEKNPEWVLICDVENTDSLYIQFNELPKAERMHWIGKYREGAKAAYDEFAIKKCKLEYAYLGEDLELYPEPIYGMFCCLVYKRDGVLL